MSTRNVVQSASRITLFPALSKRLAVVAILPALALAGCVAVPVGSGPDGNPHWAYYPLGAPIARGRLALRVVHLHEVRELLRHADRVGDVEERGLLEADVDEGGLHAGEDGVHLPLEDVSDDPLLVDAVDQELDEDVVLQDRDAGLVGRRVDDDLDGQVGSPCADITGPRGRGVFPRCGGRRLRARGIDKGGRRGSASGSRPTKCR